MTSHESNGTARSIPDAVALALGMTEKQSYNFIRIGGCNSCHSQDLPSAAAGFARSRGLRAPQEIPQLPQSMMPSPERLMDLGIVSAPSTAWELVDFGMNGVPPSAYTDAAVRAIKAMQTPVGNWSGNESRRPPMSAGDFQAAAVCIYAIRHYTPEGGEATSEKAIERAVAWLERATPQTTQDRAFHALALAWAQEGSASASRSARALLAMQRPDGGWSQLPGMVSDAYATGQALFALAVAGKMSAGRCLVSEGRRLPAEDAGSRRHVARADAIDLAAAVLRERIPLRPGSVHLDGRHRLGIDGAGRCRAAAVHLVTGSAVMSGAVQDRDQAATRRVGDPWT